MSDEKTPFDDLRVLSLERRTQLINLVEEHIRDLELHLGDMPTPSDPVNSKKYIRWERIGMSWIGKVQGQLEFSQLLGLLPPEQTARLKHRAMAAITNLTGQMVMSGHAARR